MATSPIGKTARAGARARAERSAKYRAEAARLAQAQHVAGEVIMLRTREGLTQKQLAKAIGTSETAISRLESGQHTPNLGTLTKLAEAFDLELAIKLQPKSKRPRSSRRRKTRRAKVAA
jgi:DNA-binding XRE family transcriptional regulator